VLPSAAVNGRDVLVAGGTGYIGQRLVPVLLSRGHRVRVLARASSLGRVPQGVAATQGDPLDPSSYASAVRPGDAVVHLVGTPHPSPAKAAEFQRVDLPSIRAAVSASSGRGASHLVYVSVAHPAPVMAAYISVRAEGEALIASAHITATILRPWYVIGPGHRWPCVLVPVYAAAKLIPSLRDGAERLGLVTINQMVAALAAAVDDPPSPGTQRIVTVPQIRQPGSRAVRV
jgi:uncharacterized protein YbjT (DUF2867 family)